MRYRKPNLLYYRIAQCVCTLFALIVFRRKVIRNEIKGKRGPFVVIANHQAAFDFVNLIGLTAQPMSFVISKSMFSTLPITGFLKKMGVIPKQQFQTAVADMKNMKAVIDAGQPLVIYPAGLMCEDGLSTPIPHATYKFLKWLKADIYVAKTSGTYFAMPKWAKGMRPGKTFIDVYRLFSKEELAQADIETIREKTAKHLMFDAYREQENHPVAYLGNQNIQGLEHVLYQCPVCREEFSMAVREKNTIFCNRCGFSQYSDRYGFFHKLSGPGEEMRYVSDWSRLIFRNMETQLQADPGLTLSAETEILMIPQGKHTFQPAGTGTLVLQKDRFRLTGTVHGADVSIEVPTASLPSLPFSPGKYLELQHGSDIYRCALHDGKLVMKFINMTKICHQLETANMV